MMQNGTNQHANSMVSVCKTYDLYIILLLFCKRVLMKIDDKHADINICLNIFFQIKENFVQKNQPFSAMLAIYKKVCRPNHRTADLLCVYA